MSSTRPVVNDRTAASRTTRRQWNWERFTAADHRFGWVEWVALVLYTALVAWLTAHHEPWPDEAQAWLIARDNSFLGVLRQVHYEGSPALWHVLLWVEAQLGVTYAGMHWISSAFGCLTAYLLLRFSPFPRWAKLLLPFGAFLLFHAPIIARSYGFSILLILLLAELYTAHRDRFFTGCVVCGLLANTSLYAFAGAVGFAALLLMRELRQDRKHFYVGLAIIGAFMLIAVQQTVPAPDAAFSFATQLNKNATIRNTFSALTGIPVNYHAIEVKKVRDDAGQAEAKQIAADELRAGKTPAKPPEEATGLLGNLVLRIKLMAHAVVFFVSGSPFLAAVFYLGLITWFIVHRSGWVALPFILMLLAGDLLNYTEHHVLMLWGALVAVLWMAWPQRIEESRWIDPLFAILLLAVLVEQAGWSVNVARQDVYGTFDPGKQMALFLKEHAAGKRVDTVTYYEVGSQPYLAENPYHNVSTSYWPWTIDKEPADDLRGLARERPDMIVASTNVFGTAVLGNVLRTHIALHQPFYSDKVVTKLKAFGYVETHRFCGRQPMHFGYAEENCLVVLVPGATLQPRR